MEKEIKLAILIDAENISSKYVDIILSEANALGNVIYKRIYGNWTMQHMSSWRDIILDKSILPIQQYHNKSGKNSSDSSLIIDAMDLLYLGKLNGFCIVSSDSDFTRLAARLRESEMYVLGMGEQKTPRSFISACSKFSYLDILYSSSKKNAGRKEPKNTEPEKIGVNGEIEVPTENQATSNEEKAGSNIEIVKLSLQQIAEENSDEEGWIYSGLLGTLLIKQIPDFDVRNFGYKKFFPFIDSLDLFETKCTGDPSQKLIFFKLKQQA